MLLLVLAATAAPLNPWGSATAPGTVLVNPYLYLYPDAVNPLVYGSVGLSSHVDLYVGYGAMLPSSGAGNGTLEVFPRFFLVPELALVPHLYWTPGSGSVSLAPEAHVNWSNDRASLVANVGWRPSFGSSGFSAGSIPLSVAPEYRFDSRFSVYLEGDPTFSLQKEPITLQLVPGFGITLDPAGHHSLSVGLQVPVLPVPGPASLGFWYCYSFPVTG